ncbi:MAG TPA: L,D-transpeptidase [Pyrinomonadaceae bacterium]|nr:L,D-transpeptidase [Pyrinomonadaceae bacterium]
MQKFATIIFVNIVLVISSAAQSYLVDIKRESARSDKFTGGSIARATLEHGNDDLRITINVPAFQMTLWQGGKELRSYPIGVGLIEYPIIIGMREALSVEWNPVWIPPSSDWIEKSSTVKPGEIVLPTDPRNPLGKVKIPLGYGYLIHQAKGPGDMGSLVSHGCVRVMQADLYDLAEKIVAARSLDVSSRQIAAAKRNKKTLVATLEPTIPVEITYDTIVVESGRLNVYPDVYNYGRNTVANVRTELKTSGVDDRRVTDAEIKRMITAAAGKRKFVVDTASIEKGNALVNGRTATVVASRR